MRKRAECNTTGKAGRPQSFSSSIVLTKIGFNGLVVVVFFMPTLVGNALPVQMC